MAAAVVEDVSTAASIKLLMENFAHRTTFHGCGRTVIRSLARRILWIFLVLICSVWSLYQLSIILQNFFTHPEVSKVALKHDSSLTFPAVTICNMNPLRKKKLPKKELEYIDEEVKSSKSTSFRTLQDEILRNIDFEVRKEAWHNITDMLKQCTFNQVQCSPENFTGVEDRVAGQCFTFNRKGSTEKRYMPKAGPQYGLELQLSIELEEYISLTSIAGMCVIVHDPDEPPFLEDGGILVTPGHATSIGLKKTRIHRLSAPYGRCVNNHQTDEQNLYASLNYNYTQSGCMKSCYQNWLVQLCGCCDIDLPCNQTVISKMQGTVVPFCNIKNDTDNDCVSSTVERFKTDHTKCTRSCPPACDESVYETVVSFASWPSEANLEQLLDLSNETNETELREKSILNFQKNNLMVEVFYDSLDVTEIVKEPAYDWNKVFSEVGGQMGLWMGFSILTGMEILELLLDITVMSIRRFIRKLLPKEMKTKL